MILHKLTFGPVSEKKKNEAQDLAEQYIATLLHNGQVCGDYSYATSQGSLVAYIHLSGIAGQQLKHHSKYGLEDLKRISEFFGQSPNWQRLEDDAPRRDTTWKKAPFLYLFTHLFDQESPLCRGDNGKPIPLYLLPGPHESREGIYFWQESYRHHDALWIGCGELEIPVYRQLADPNSELSQRGIDICKTVEKATKIPTYYYLMRYWGRRNGEDNRRCPGCDRAWRTKQLQDHKHPFWYFEFQCHHCRLVSHLADNDEDERHAFIGEPARKSRRVKK